MKRRIKDLLLTKNIFGLGEVPMSAKEEQTCRIVPTTIPGFSKVIIEEVAKPVIKPSRAVIFT
jgi:hypothetical protein